MKPFAESISDQFLGVSSPTLQYSIMLMIGEHVLLRQKRLRKSMTRYADRDLVVIAIKTSMITVRDDEGNEITRDASKFKRRNFEGPAGNRTDAGLGSEPNAERPRTETETNNAATNGQAQRGAHQTDNVRETPSRKIRGA